ncbi:PREDICTED: tripartite motif-containing protein 3-like [Branchiostoma belcheri]|uniref:Tripartite motif-containing protein 3-like n=1 Tax=Branchiostoma belcheri TaxID=7741 RepID=A0A6P5ACU6_BRABE|nr:PREDICTED: tripartite motif-containing protein 3-like [Branchiostoma belcheri]
MACAPTKELHQRATVMAVNDSHESSELTEEATFIEDSHSRASGRFSAVHYRKVPSRLHGQALGKPARLCGQTPGDLSGPPRKTSELSFRRSGQDTDHELPSRRSEQATGLPSRRSGQENDHDLSSRRSGQKNGHNLSSRHSGQANYHGPPPGHSGKNPAGPSRHEAEGQTPAGRFVLPKERDVKRAGVYRHRLRREDLNKIPLNPMYGADLPSGPDGSVDDQQETTPKEPGGPFQVGTTSSGRPGGQGQGAAQGHRPAAGLAASGPATHTYEDGDTFHQGLGKPLSRDAGRAPPVPSTPRPGGRTTADGRSQPDPAAAHTYENGDQFRQGFGPPLNRDVLGAPPVPSTPRPGGGQQVPPVGLNPLQNPQDILRQLRPNPMYSSNHAPLPPQATSDQGSKTYVIPFSDESGPGKLRTVRAVAVSPDNKIWVAAANQARLQVYSMAGGFLHEFPQDAPGLGYPGKDPSQVSIDRDGHLWVFMNGYPRTTDTVVQFDREGNLKTKFDLPEAASRGPPRGMAVGLHVYVTWSDGYRGGLQAFRPDGNLLWEVGQQPQVPRARMKTPKHVATDGNGKIYVSDWGTHTIYIFDEDGKYKGKFGSPGRSGGRLNRPEGICVDPSSGHVLVADSENRRVVVYTSQGRYVRYITITNSPHPYVGKPDAIAVGPSGQLVVDKGNAIIVFTRY